jgi:hypothetical protein
MYALEITASLTVFSAPKFSGGPFPDPSRFPAFEEFAGN